MVAEPLLEHLLEALPAQSSVAWLAHLRAEAVERVSALTVPTTRDEAWRFTDLAQLKAEAIQFRPVADGLNATEVTEAGVLPWNIAEAGVSLVFVDGVYAPHLSKTKNAGAAAVTTFANARHVEAVKTHLGQHAKFHDQAFVALNTAFLHEGAVVHVPANAQAGTIHVLFIATRPQSASHPRCLVVADAGSAVAVVEEYAALTDAAYLANAVTEIVVSDNARVEHVRVQSDSVRAFHIANAAVRLGRDAQYRSVSVAQGARISRYDLHVLQAGANASCVVDGVALIAGEQLADTHTHVEHAQPHGTSRQLHKCIVGGSAHAVFNGRIHVRPGAQQTDSEQASRNLLLSGRAQIDTKPQLEIFADDVKCAHGATVGRLDEDAVFYLRSRGLAETDARALLTYAFAAEVIERVPFVSLRARLERNAAAKLKERQ